LRLRLAVLQLDNVIKRLERNPDASAEFAEDVTEEN
jgi:hypothetical protein